LEKHIIKNGTNADVTIFNMQETGGFVCFPNGKDLVENQKKVSALYLKSYQLSKQWWLARLRWYSDRHYNKVDKVSGERLINADEIVKLSNQSIQTQETETNSLMKLFYKLTPRCG
jgi:hypothetical protein